MAIDIEACDMYEAGDLKGALAKLRQTERPFCAERLWMECSILASLGLHEEAVLLASEGYAVYPSCETALNLGWHYNAQGEPTRALALLESCQPHDGRGVERDLLAASCMLKLGRFGQTRQLLEGLPPFEDLTPVLRDCRFGIELQLALSSQPTVDVCASVSSAFLFVSYGTKVLALSCLAAADRWADVEVLLSRFFTHDTSYYVIVARLRLALSREDKTTVKKMARQLLKENRSAYALKLCAIAYDRIGAWRSAVACYREVATIATDRYFACERLAVLHLKRMKIRKVDAYARQCLDIKPSASILYIVALRSLLRLDFATAKRLTLEATSLESRRAAVGDR